MLNTISSGSSGISASYLNSLISAELSVRQKPLDTMKSNLDTLETSKSIYSDLATQISNLKTQVEALVKGADGLDSKTVSVTDTSILTATASSSAVNGSYKMHVSQLAEAHQVYSKKMDYTNRALNLSGSFYLGGNATASASVTGGTDSGGKATVASVSTGTVASDTTQLGTGDYYVEARKYSEGVYQFRVVDANGDAVQVAKTTDSTKYTSNWQTWTGGSFDTGRGLVVNFGDTPAEDLTGKSAAKVSYQAAGAKISVSATDTLEGIAGKVNDGTYADGNGVVATVVDNQLVLTAAKTGTSHAIAAPVLGDNAEALLGSSGLGLGTFTSGAWTGWTNTAQEAQNAKVTVNGMTVEPESNTGLTNVVKGLTIDLANANEKTTDYTYITVATDTANIKTRTTNFITEFNNMTKYLAAKTSVTQGTDGTYTRGALASDSVFSTLSSKLMSDTLQTLSGLSADSPTSLKAIGISFDIDETSNQMTLGINDSDTFNDALKNNPDGVLELLNGIMEKMQNRIGGFTGTTGSLSKTQSIISDQIKKLNSDITDEQASLDEYEAMMTAKYTRLLSQYATMQSSWSTFYSIFSSAGSSSSSSSNYSTSA